ncbi:MAG: radical SAM protein [Myxococcales bacterium]|nr:radical SAM protein [Myxococcales bacterium]
MAKFLTLTDKCNLRCAFCYEISPIGEPHTFEADAATFAEELYRAMHDEGWKQVVITGGEPTLMPTFFPAIAECRRQGYEQIIVASNGRRFSYQNYTQRAKDAGLTHANISLFGADRRTHDGTTKVRGSFEQTISGIQNLVTAGINVSVSVVVNRRNVRSLDAVFRLIHQLSVRRSLVMGLKPFGGAFIERDKVFYDFEEGAPYVNAALRFGLGLGLDITTMGLPNPPFDTSGTRDDNIRALKYFDYILKRMKEPIPYCKGILCDRCFGRNVCPEGAEPGQLIVCKCVSVNEDTIRAAVRRGHQTVRAVSLETQACTECKTCAADIAELIRCEKTNQRYDPRNVAALPPGSHG